MEYSYQTQGVCSKEIRFSLDNGKISNVKFSGGCPGNLQGISKLVEGQDASEVAKRLSGVRCGAKATSCPDQLARAINQAMASK